jgi:hypothetical protein
MTREIGQPSGIFSHFAHCFFLFLFVFVFKKGGLITRYEISSSKDSSPVKLHLMRATFYQMASFMSKTRVVQM